MDKTVEVYNIHLNDKIFQKVFVHMVMMTHSQKVLWCSFFHGINHIILSLKNFYARSIQLHRVLTVIKIVTCIKINIDYLPFYKFKNIKNKGNTKYSALNFVDKDGIQKCI